jgi:hypothetical protein
MLWPVSDLFSKYSVIFPSFLVRYDGVIAEDADGMTARLVFFDDFKKE